MQPVHVHIQHGEHGSVAVKACLREMAYKAQNGSQMQTRMRPSWSGCIYCDGKTG